MAEIQFKGRGYVGDYKDIYSYEYNDQGQLVEIDGLDVGRSFVMDIVHGAEGPVEISIDGRDGFMAYSYENGRLVSRSVEDGFLGESASYAYEGDRLVEVERVYSRPGANATSRVTRYFYDDEGRVTREEGQYLEAVLRPYEKTFQYDEDGQLLRREVSTNGRVQAFEYVYEEGRVVEIHLSVDGGGRRSAEVKYHADGLLASVDSLEGRLVITYEDGPVTALPVTLLLTEPPGVHEIPAPYFDHHGRTVSGIDVESLNFFLE